MNGDLADTPSWNTVKGLAVTLGQIIKRNNAASYQICTVAGTAGSGAEPAFSDTAGTATTDNTITWKSLGAVSNFTGGQAPHARLANACAATWFAAGNTIYVGDNHAESQATAITISATGTVATVSKILCHNHSGPYPPTGLSTGATISTTAAANLAFGSFTGAFYVYGLSLQAGSGASAGAANILIGGAASGLVLDNCSLQTLDSAAGSAVQLGTATSTATLLTLNNTSVKFGNVGHSINLDGCNLLWSNTAPGLAVGSAAPTNLFSLNFTNTINNFTIEAVDLSAVTGSLVSFAQAMPGNFTLKDCKLNASATIATPVNSGSNVQLVRSDSGATAYKSSRITYEGTETTETAITRVGGAADPTGQAQARKIVTTANPQWLRPFKAEPYAIWNPSTGANVTATVYGTINAGALPNNDDIWLEVEYLGSSASPLGTMVTTTKSNLLAANAAVASDGSTWNGGGSGAGWSPFKLTTTLSSPQPGMAGYLHARVRAAKPSTTYYLDAKVVLS